MRPHATERTERWRLGSGARGKLGRGGAVVYSVVECGYDRGETHLSVVVRDVFQLGQVEKR